MKQAATKKVLQCALSCVLAATLIAGVATSARGTDAKQSLNPDPSQPQYYSRYSSIEEARKTGNAINEDIAEEGITLFKNTEVAPGQKSLPLAGGSKISLFGSVSTNLRQSGGGSGSGTSNDGEYLTTEQVFTQAGFKINKTLYSMYERVNSRGEISMSYYTEDITGSYKDYSDAAVIFISRADGGENYDASLGNGFTNHSQQMNNNEIALFEHVKAQVDEKGEPLFKNIIVCINTADPFEVARYQDDDRVQGVIWMGLLGSTGHKALPKVLNGEVNPSGHTVDIWPADLRQDPAWFNFADNNQVGGSIDITGTDPSGVKLEEAIAEDGEVANPIFKALTYKEGIYMGYRWYETAATVDGYFSNTVGEEDVSDPLHPEDAYYNRHNGVLYPFGYGLSYTQFSWTIGEPSFAEGAITEADAGTEVTVPVTVKNTGRVPGKDVVQLYVRAPYDKDDAPIEKSDVTFVNFTKTKLLDPGEEQTVQLTFNIRDLASFDWNDINHNGFQGYELEEGTYEMLFRTDSHTDKNAGDKLVYRVEKGIKYNSEELDSPLNYNQGFGENAKAVFSQEDEYNSSGTGAINAEGTHAMKQDADYVSRADWKLPTPSTPDQLAWSDEAVDILFNQTYTSAAGTNGDRPTDPWYVEADEIPGWGKSRDELQPGDWSQASEADVDARVNGKTEKLLKDMIGIPFDDVRWTEFMNQLTFDEMVYLTQNGWYKSPGLDAIGKPETRENDGPGQLTYGEKSTFWACETTISATYNTELAYKMGDQMGQECILLNVFGWYAPGLNTHRLAFNGRNFEYYSSDGRQGGWMAAAVIQGVVDNGIHVYAKHYVCNDMETCRNYGGGVSIFLTEQALREIYLRPFEIAAKYGDMNGIMTCHGKVGLIRVESNYYLCNYFLYDECGYDGSSITDANAGAYTTTIGGSAQQVTGDRLERCRVVPLAWNETAASSEGALNGRKVEGRYDAENNKLMVPEIYVSQEDWHFTGEHDGYEETTGYQTTITNSGKWDQESPTQWYNVRMTCQYLLYQVANSAALGVGNGDQLGVMVTVHGTDGSTTEIGCKIGDLISEPEAPEINAAQERFVGWYTDEACTQPASFPMSAVRATHLYPLVVPMTSCVQTFDLNYEGAPAPVTQYYEEDTLVNLPAFSPVREGYAFGGWYLEPSCVNAVSATDTNALVITSDRTFYAKWTAVESFTVTFDYNYENSPAGQQVTVASGDTVTPPVFAPSREGYVFAGWYIDEAGEYAADFTQAVEYDTVFYASWKPLTEVTEGSGCAGSSGTGFAAIGGLAVLGAAVFAINRARKNKNQAR